MVTSPPPPRASSSSFDASMIIPASPSSFPRPSSSSSCPPRSSRPGRSESLSNTWMADGGVGLLVAVLAAAVLMPRVAGAVAALLGPRTGVLLCCCCCSVCLGPSECGGAAVGRSQLCRVVCRACCCCCCVRCTGVGGCGCGAAVVAVAVVVVVAVVVDRPANSSVASRICSSVAVCVRAR